MSDTNSIATDPAAASAVDAAAQAGVVADSAGTSSAPASANEQGAAPPNAARSAKSGNPDAIATDEEVQAALAEAAGTDLPSLDDGTSSDPPIVPVVVTQPQGAASSAALPAGGEGGGKKLSFKINAKAASDSAPAAAAATAAKPAAATASKPAAKTAPAATPARGTPSLADVRQNAAASRATLKGIGGLMYRTADSALTVLHVPFGWIGSRARIVLGGLAVSTAIISMLSGWLIPSMFAKVDLNTHVHQRRAAAEAALAARLEAAKAAAAGERSGGEGHGGGEDHGGGHGGEEKSGAKEAKPAGGHGAEKEAKPAGGHGH